MSINKVSNPIEFLIDFAWASGADQFTVNNAKDELKKMRQQLTDLQNNDSYANVAWARINDRGDLYDPRLQLNPFVDEKTIVPLYANKEELKNFLDKNR